MTLNDYYGQMQAARKQYQDYLSRNGGFGLELQDAVRKNNDVYKTLNDEVNTAGQDYYNSGGKLLQQYKDTYKNDPTALLAAIQGEQSRLGKGYNNLLDVRSQKEYDINDLMKQFVQAGNLQLQNQENAYKFAQDNYQDSQARAAQAAQQAWMQQMADAGKPKTESGQDVPQVGRDGKPIKAWKGAIGTTTEDGKYTITDYVDGYPVLEETSNVKPYDTAMKQQGGWSTAIQNGIGRDSGFSQATGDILAAGRYGDKGDTGGISFNPMLQAKRAKNSWDMLWNKLKYGNNGQTIAPKK